MTSNALTLSGALRQPEMEGNNQFLTFMLDGETFAIGILAIKAIIEYGSLTTVPLMPVFVRGVINLRGAVVPVIDLSARFGRGVTSVNRRSCIVIVEIEGEEGSHDVGVVVDAVNEVLDIDAAQIEPPPSFGAGIRSEFIRGMGKIDGQFVIILDVNRVLSVEEMSQVAQLGESAPAALPAGA